MNMSATEWLGVVAGCCTTASFAPQAIQVFKTRRVADISLAMYVSFVTGVALWLVYGVLVNSIALIVSNAITVVLAGSVLTMKLLLDKKVPGSVSSD